MPEIIDRQTASAMGLKRYFTGKPCRRGHVSERFLANGHCKECERERDRRRMGRRRSRDSRYWQQQREYKRLYRLAHPEQHREYRRRYRLAEQFKGACALRALKELGITF